MYPQASLDSYPQDTRRAIKERFFALAVGRALQFHRVVDIVSVRKFIGGNENCNPILGGRFSIYKTDGAVVGEDSGRKDKRGFPYKSWRLVDAEKAKDVLKRQHIKPLHATAMNNWLPSEE
jgi:hypothetical protein